MKAFSRQFCEQSLCEWSTQCIVSLSSFITGLGSTDLRKKEYVGRGGRNQLHCVKSEKCLLTRCNWYYPHPPEVLTSSVCINCFMWIIVLLLCVRYTFIKLGLMAMCWKCWIRPWCTWRCDGTGLCLKTQIQFPGLGVVGHKIITVLNRNRNLTCGNVDD